MRIARVVGSAVSTIKVDSLRGSKLLVVREASVTDELEGKPFVAVDGIGAGEGELVMFCQGSSARAAQGLKSIPVDAAIVAIIDRVEVHGKNLYKGG